MAHTRIGVISGTNARSVEENADLMIRLGAFWHRGAFVTNQVVRLIPGAPATAWIRHGVYNEYSIVLDRKERRSPLPRRTQKPFIGVERTTGRKVYPVGEKYVTVTYV